MTAPFPVIGIGASAGGIWALEGFFRGLPDVPGVALIVVTHLSPERESLLHEIIGRYTRLPVHVAADGAQVEVDHVYVLPADAVLSIDGGRLRIRKQGTSRRERKPIDVFFSSLAVDLGDLAGGIVLSGGDSDGTLGVKAIKERGGLTMAQVSDGYGPDHADMPDSAIATGLVDFAIPVDEMGARLAEFARGVRLIEPAEAGGDERFGQGLDRARPEIYAILRNQLGHDFSGYKLKTFSRRVQRRMHVTRLETADAYLGLLRQNPQEVNALFRDLLINVTSFFRDAEAFEALADAVIPKLFEGRGADDVIRIWVPGCSTGEEVYSIGILVREYADRVGATPRVQIFASDIDEHSLAVARGARYPVALLDSVSPERQARFFVADGGSYVVSKDVREMCIFSPHSVLRDPPFSRMDLISCRNLLIYFGVNAQDQVIPTFHYALRPEGYLFLGTSESITHFDDLFVAVEKKHRIFRRRSDSGHGLRLPLSTHGALRARHVSDLTPRPSPFGTAALRNMVDIQILERFTPAHVAVNRDGDIVYYSSRTGKYLEAAAGAPTRQLMAVARKELRLDLRSLFREAVETGRAATRQNLALDGDDGRVQLVNVTIEPLSQPASGAEPLYLILFADQGAVLSREDFAGRETADQSATAEQNERELRETRDRLQSTIEEYETALEELKSSNEELVSVNEELQSTNEELEASEEELISLNEELHTVNAELNRKVEELDRTHSDLQNLFDSTEVATVFLDGNSHIRSYTPQMAQIFSIRPGDRGRPITELASRFSLPGFAEDVAAVLTGRRSLERTIEHRERGANYLVRLAPYRDGNKRVDGVVVSFIDVTSMTRAEARQQILIAELQHRTRNLLGIVQSIAQQTLRKGGSLDDFSIRLSALGRVQGLISQAMGETIDLGEIVRLELAAVGGGDKATVKGPSVPLDLATGQTFALALHELVTNAVKYGALNGQGGRLEVIWTVEPRADRTVCVVLLWQESGVVMPTEPPKRGYGRLLIERALAHTLDARTNLVFGPDGVQCRIEMTVASGPGAAAFGTAAGD